MAYILGWLLIYFAIFTASISNYQGRFLGALVIFYFAIISIFRGAVGTDTATYEILLSNFSLETLLSGMEPGFVLLGLALLEVTGSAEVALRSVSAIFFILVTYYFLRADSNERFVLIAYIAPAYFYQYSMNVVRIGLASILLMIVLQKIRENKALKSGFIALSALFFHYSVFVSIVYSFSALSNALKLKYVSAVAIISTVIVYFYYGYFSSKLSLYLSLDSPGVLSGISKLVVILVLVAGLAFSRLRVGQALKLAVITMIFTLLAFGLSLFSYAGLRILDLIAFILPIIIIMFHAKDGKKFNWETKCSYVLAGMISMAAVLRGFLLEAGQGKSPFLPYHFIGGIF